MRLLAIIVALVILGWQLPPHWSLLLGLILTLVFKVGPDLTGQLKKFSAKTLQLSIILLGASLNFKTLMGFGATSFVLSGVSIGWVFLCALLLNRVFQVSSPLRELMTAGTAICGGSAIGAIAPIIQADHLSIAVAMGVVFLLNGVSVFLFPPLGEWLVLTQEQFGIWSALAIHDTSAVVAAAGIFGDKALEVATTLKLSRALWILPLSFIFALRKQAKENMAIPWFIVLFVLTSLAFTFTPGIQVLIPSTKAIAKSGFSLTLFMIGLGLNRQQIMGLKLNQILFGVSLWLVVVLSSLFFLRWSTYVIG